VDNSRGHKTNKLFSSRARPASAGLAVRFGVLFAYGETMLKHLQKLRKRVCLFLEGREEKTPPNLPLSGEELDSLPDKGGLGVGFVSCLPPHFNAEITRNHTEIFR